jgi:hypothetical protein
MELSPLAFYQTFAARSTKIKILKAFWYTDILLSAELQAGMPALPGVFSTQIFGALELAPALHEGYEMRGLSIDPS